MEANRVDRQKSHMCSAHQTAKRTITHTQTRARVCICVCVCVCVCVCKQRQHVGSSSSSSSRSAPEEQIERRRETRSRPRLLPLLACHKGTKEGQARLSNSTCRRCNDTTPQMFKSDSVYSFPCPATH